MADFQDDSYDAAVGPKVRIKREGGGPSDHTRVRQGPRDLERSRKRGITTVTCACCGANCGTTPIHHTKSCAAAREGFPRIILRTPAKLYFR